MKYILIILLLFSITASAQVKVGADGAIHATGAYPSAVERELKGYVLSVKGLAERNAIPSNFRDTGMIILVRDSSYLYSLVGGIANSNWQLFSSAGSISGGDTTVFNIVVDSTGQSAYRVLYGRGGNKIGSDPTFLYDSIHNKLVINTSNFSRGGNSTKLYVNGNTWFDGNQINRGNLTLTGTATISTTASGTAGTDSLLVQNNGLVKKISPTYYSTGSAVSVFDSLTWISALDWNIKPSNSAATNTTNFVAAIAYLNGRKGGTLYFPFADSAYKGTFVIATAGANWATIRLLGANPPNMYFGTIGSVSLNTKGVILQDIDSTTNAVITVTGDAALYLENLDIRTYDSSKIGGVDASLALQLNMVNCFVNTGVYNVLAKQPRSTSFGINTPVLNNGGLIFLSNVAVTGYYKGIIANEHTYGEYVKCYSNYYGAWIKASNQNIQFVRPDFSRNRYTISADNGIASIMMDYLNIEHCDSATQTTASTKWQVTQADVNDPSDVLRGYIDWFTVLGNLGTHGIFTKIGGDSLSYGTNGTPYISTNPLDITTNLNAKGVSVTGKSTGFTNGFDAYNADGNFAGLRMNGSTYAITNFQNRGLLFSTKGLVVATNANVVNGGTDPLSFNIGGYDNTTQERMRLTTTGLGIGTPTPINLLDIPGFNTTNSQARIGDIEFQSYAASVSWFGDNTYFDGANFKYRYTGTAGMFLFNAGEGAFRVAASGTAGTTNSQFNTYSQVKINNDGTFATGFQVNSTPGNYTGALFKVAGGTGIVTMSHYGAGAATFDASGNISSVSDERVKNILGFDNTGLRQIMNIKPIVYKYNGLSGNETNGTYVGFSAQNVKANIPYSTGVTSDGYLTLQDRAVMAAMVNAIQEQQKEIEDLRQEIKHLKKK